MYFGEKQNYPKKRMIIGAFNNFTKYMLSSIIIFLNRMSNNQNMRRQF